MADNNIEVGKLCCPKCSIDLIYDEKTYKEYHFTSQGTSFIIRKIFKRWWVFDYNRVRNFYKFEDCWFIKYKLFKDK